MQHAQNFDLAFTHPIRNYIGQTPYHQFAGAQKPARPSGGGLRDKRGLGAFHQFEDNTISGGATILSDVFRDVVEILTSEPCSSKPQAASPISISVWHDR